MQISSLINSTNEDPLDEPKILIRFAPYINTDACPTADEITNYLNRTDKHIFLMLGQRHFSIRYDPKTKNWISSDDIIDLVPLYA